MNKFDWLKYIDFAGDLLEQDDNDEAKRRCGISRAYYGAYNKVVSYMKEKNIYSNNFGEGSHQTVIKDCKNFGSNNKTEAEKAWKRIGDKLGRMKVMRVKADYRECYFQEGFTGSMKNELAKAVQWAQAIASDVETIRKEET